MNFFSSKTKTIKTYGKDKKERVINIGEKDLRSKQQQQLHYQKSQEEKSQQQQQQHYQQPLEEKPPPSQHYQQPQEEKNIEHLSNNATISRTPLSPLFTNNSNIIITNDKSLTNEDIAKNDNNAEKIKINNISSNINNFLNISSDPESLLKLLKLCDQNAIYTFEEFLGKE